MPVLRPVSSFLKHVAHLVQSQQISRQMLRRRTADVKCEVHHCGVENGDLLLFNGTL